METYLKWLGAAVIVGIVFVVGMQFSEENSLGSNVTGSEYNATSTYTQTTRNMSQIRTSTGAGCTLGSVIVASSSASALTINPLKVWNATSTTDSASTTLVTLRSAAAEGTYTFDVSCPRGLIIETPANFNGEYVVTWR